MPELSEEFFQQSEFLNALESIIRNGDPEVQTAATIRRDLEKEFNFEAKSLDEKPWKKIINRAIDTTFARIQDEQQEQSQESAVKEEEEEGKEQKQEKDEKGEKENEEPPESPQQQDEEESIKEEEKEEQEEEDQQKEEHYDDTEKAVKSEYDSDDQDFKSSPPAAQKKKKRQRSETPKSDDASEKEAPKKKRVRKEKESSKKEKTSQSDETIKRLKMYINKCGVRKSWQKELADCKTKKDQIDKLKSILEELGVEGRPTLEKCQKIKAERELKAEIESLDTSNILNDNGSGRRTRLASRKRRRIVASDEEDNDDEQQETSKAAAKKPDPGFDTSFLGDQSSDSD